MSKRSDTYEDKEIRRLKRQNWDLRQEINRLRKALRNNNIKIDGREKVEKRCTPRKGVQEPKKEVNSNEFNKEEFLKNIREQRVSDGTWDINKEEEE